MEHIGVWLFGLSIASSRRGSTGADQRYPESMSTHWAITAMSALPTVSLTKLLTNPSASLGNPGSWLLEAVAPAAQSDTEVPAVMFTYDPAGAGVQLLEPVALNRLAVVPSGHGRHRKSE